MWRVIKNMYNITKSAVLITGGRNIQAIQHRSGGGTGLQYIAYPLFHFY